MELVLLGELANVTKEDNKVYYSIYNKDSNFVLEKTIMVEPNNREIMKESVANNVLEDLWNTLIKN